MAKQKSKQKEQVVNVVDIHVDLPEEHKDLCDGGSVHFLLNRKTIEFVQTITDELVRSRGLPVRPEAITTTDPVVVHYLTKERDLTVLDARAKAVRWYQQEIHQCSSDAMMIALTDNNNINLTAKPYEDGEIAFSNRATTADDAIPAWRKGLEEIQVPPPERNLRNVYENRLKVVADLLDECGTTFSLVFYRAFSEAMGSTIRLLQDQDEDGFHVPRVVGKIHDEPSTT